MSESLQISPETDPCLRNMQLGYRYVKCAPYGSMATGSEVTVLITASATIMNATTGNMMKRIRIVPCGENSQVSGSTAVPGG